MKKIMFTGSDLTIEEKENLLNRGYMVDEYKTTLSKKEIIDLIDKNNYDGYILGGDEIFDEKTINALNSSLKVISFYGVGYEAYIDTIACSNKGIVVTNTPKTNTNAVSEHTIGLMICSIRNILYNNTNMKNGEWVKEKINDLCGLTVGIIGMGAIGSQVAKILHYSFGAKVIYYSPTRKGNLEEELNMKYVSLEELYAESDVVSLHCLLNEETKNMINNKAFKLMKDGVILINTARAALIDPKALLENLNNGKVKTVAFDSFYKEPINLVEDKDFNEFSKFNNKQLILSPHVAYYSNQALNNMKKMAVDNVIDVLENRTCVNIVNKKVNVTRSEDEYSGLLLEDYNFYIIEEERFIDRIKQKLIDTLNPSHIETALSFSELLKLPSIKDNNKKIIMVYSELLGEGEFVSINELERINNLKAICYGCTFLDKLDLEWCKKNNVVVTVLDDYRVDMRTDLIFYIIQSLIGEIPNLIKGKNNDGILSMNLHNKKIGFLGYTEITRKLIEKSKLFGMKIAYYSEKYRSYDELVEFNTLEQLFSTSEIIVTCGYPKEEQYIINNEKDFINPNAYVVSCEQGNQNLNKKLFIDLAESKKIKGFGYTSAKDIITDYKENIFIIKDTTWATDDSYKKLCRSWIQSVKSVLDNTADDLTKK